MNGLLEILKLVQELKSVEGRKKLQKIVFILQSQGHPFPQHFGYLHYGPYSSELASEIDTLVDGNLMEQSGGGGQYNPYTYTPGKTLAKLLREVGDSQAPSWSPLAQLLNSRDANFLEALSTVLYLRQSGFDGKRLDARFAALKPALTGLLPKVKAFAQQHSLAATA